MLKIAIAESYAIPAYNFEEIEKRVSGLPIVLHGASTVVPEYVEIINTLGF